MAEIVIDANVIVAHLYANDAQHAPVHLAAPKSAETRRIAAHILEVLAG
jgi:hypothetical protein